MWKEWLTHIPSNSLCSLQHNTHKLPVTPQDNPTDLSRFRHTFLKLWLWIWVFMESCSSKSCGSVATRQRGFRLVPLPSQTLWFLTPDTQLSDLQNLSRLTKLVKLYKASSCMKIIIYRKYCHNNGAVN